MENIDDKKISDLAKELRIKKFNEVMKSVDDYMRVASKLVEMYPDKSVEELSEIYERQCQTNEKNVESR